MVLVAVRLSVAGLYLPPVFQYMPCPNPPQTIISLPVHTAVCWLRFGGAWAVRVLVQVSGVHPAAALDMVGSV
jgi:hypothetical protein